jgi:hypothetical protein
MLQPAEPRPPGKSGLDDWTFPAAAALTSVARAREVVSTVAFATSAFRDASGLPRGKTLGRRVAIFGSPAHSTVA